ncbi:hypothetical protein OEZ85_010742 [Tetradesmus obliquus]|uniref:NAD-dependent epimerase/dehydratase domain-containing protein n=1 Tax=Tetradesmus obliquus TaxID=3088 RepID=A0ABY8TN72_TETOB|nr:hypothetical protein OEZ85_010742 [Tetradesmus obliquus]
MLQQEFWNILFFGLLSSFVVYNVHFGAGTVHAVHRGGSSRDSSIARLLPMPGKQSLLISSGAGPVAVLLATALLEEGHAVTLLDYASSGVSTDKLYSSLQSSSTSSSSSSTGSSSVAGRLQFASCDMQNTQQLADVLDSGQPDAVVLLAGSAAGESEPKLAFLDSTSSRVLSLLSAIGNSTVSKLLVSSSLAVYGQHSNTPVSEDSTCCKPASMQGHTAQLVEAAVQAYAAATPSLSAAILRHGFVFGAPSSAGLGTASGAALGAARNPPTVYIVGSGRAYSQRDVWKACHKLFGGGPQANEELPSDEACQGITADTSKFTAHTGWRAKLQLEDALIHALQRQQGTAAQAQH